MCPSHGAEASLNALSDKSPRPEEVLLCSNEGRPRDPKTSAEPVKSPKLPFELRCARLGSFEREGPVLRCRSPSEACGLAASCATTVVCNELNL